MRARAHRVLDHLRRQWMGALSLFLVLTGGVAYAANTIASSDIIDGQVKTADLGADAVNSAKIANGQVLSADIGAGEVRSANVANDNLTGGDIAANALKGADIDEATLDIGDSARAYAYVSPDNCTGPFGACTPEQAKGVSNVTRVSTGDYCVIAPGINSAVTPAAVTVDWARTAGAEGNASAMTSEFGCGAGNMGFGVLTEREPVIAVDSGGGTNNQQVSGPAVADDLVAFTIVIP